MLNSNDLLTIIKKAAMEAIEASQPSDFCFGKVISKKPLKISVEQKMVLSSAQLVLTKTAQNNLSVDEKVVLLKQKGGQKYLVLDRVVNA
ncbi:MAG: DUF2577 domain-containing protein [Eubacterium sp.]|nr:DUF2577 domain-containing protein [Eubacterium sp.]